MAEAGANMSNPSIPLFMEENYELWSIKMVTLFKSQGLWDLVNNGVSDSDPNQQENEREDARALFYIQLAVNDTIFSRIATATNAKEAWTTLKTAFQGSTQVMAIKLQGLRRDFETLQMNKEETMQVFLSRVQMVVNQIRVFADIMQEKIVVAKVLRSLTPKFDHVVAAIEESKNLDTYSFNELMGSLQTHESRMSKTEDKGDEKAFYMKGESSRGGYNPSRGRANSYRGGRGQGISNQADCYNKQRE
jgi:gag-polypeptide of LTR copia-type